MKWLNINFLCLVILISLSPFTFAYNASSSSHTVRFQMGSGSINASDGNYASYGVIGPAPIANITTPSYLYSWIQHFGPISLPIINIDFPPNSSMYRNYNLVFNSTYTSLEEHVDFLTCLYSINYATNVSFACNSTNVTIILNSSTNEKQNYLLLFITDSINQTTSDVHRFFLNTTIPMRESGEEGGGGLIIDATIDTITGNIVIQEPAFIQDMFSGFVIDMFGATRDTLREVGASIFPDKPTKGILLILLVIFVLTFITRRTDKLLKTVAGAPARKEKNKLKVLRWKQKNNHPFTQEEKDWLALYNQRQKDKRLTS